MFDRKAYMKAYYRKFKARIAEHKAKWTVENHERVLATRRIWNAKNRKRINSQRLICKKARLELINRYKLKPCADCGVQYNPWVMDFDHLGEKKFTIANGYHKNLETVKAEIAKCEVVCSNCHRERTYHRIHTPFKTRAQEAR